MAVVSSLYPPLIETFMPAFPHGGPAPVTFSFSPYNSISEIKKIHVSLVNQKTNQSAFKNSFNNNGNIIFNSIWILTFNQNGTKNMKVNLTNNTCTIYIPKELLKGDSQTFVVDNYYKVQIRFDGSTATPNSTSYLQDERQFFSEWSSVCLIKAIPEIQLGMDGFDNQFTNVDEESSSKIRTVQAGIVPIAGSILYNYKEYCSKCGQEKTNNVVEDYTTWTCSSCGTRNVKKHFTSSEETLQKYRITIYLDSTNEEIDKTNGWIYTGNDENPNKIYWLADVTSTHPNDLCNIFIECVTKNQYSFEKTYQMKIASFDATPFTPIWTYQKTQLNEYGDTSEKIITEEDGMVTFTITSQEEMPRGFLYIKRATSLDNFKNWELISCTANSGKVNKTIVDPSIGSMVKYRYSCQYRLRANGNFTKTYFSPVFVYPDFYDILIYRDGRQLALRYNAQISSYSSVVNRQVINTLGSKYPRFAENAQMNYKKFSITGLLTTESDFNRKFIDDRDYAIEMQDYDNYMDGKYEVRNDTISDGTLTYAEGNISSVDYPDTKEATEHLIKNTLHDLYPKDNWWLERTFREEALAWLNDGEPKLFRSMTEGNMVVMLTDISLTPNGQVGRRLYNISMTAYEVEDGYSLDVLSSLGILNVPDDYSAYIGSITPDEGDDDDQEGIIEENVIGQLYGRKGTGNNIIYDSSTLIEDNPDVNTYTLDNFYNGLYYQGINSNYKVISNSYELRNLKIQFESSPQWYNVVNGNLVDPNNLSSINKNNLIYGYKIGLSQKTNEGVSFITVFVEEKGFYQIPQNLVIENITLYDNAIATLDYKLKYKREYDESSIPIEAETSQKIVGQISGKWNSGTQISNIIKNKYEYFKLATESDENKGFNGLLEKQYLDEITGFGFDGTSYATFQITFGKNETNGNQYVVGRTGVYNLMPMSSEEKIFPIGEITFLGRRMFRKDNIDYNDREKEVDYYIFDASTTGYQGLPTNSLGWNDLDSGQPLDVLVVFNNNVSTPERNQIVRNFIDAQTESPYASISDIMNPVKNTVYGVYNNQGDVILMLFNKDRQWQELEVVNPDSTAYVVLNVKGKRPSKKKFFLEEWEFSLDKSAKNSNENILTWYRTFIGNIGTSVSINNSQNINPYITDINGDILIPEIDGYRSINDIKNPEYNTVYGFKNEDEVNGDKIYKIYYINQGWYDVEFIDSQQQVILAQVPVYGMINYRGNIVKIKYA